MYGDSPHTLHLVRGVPGRMSITSQPYCWQKTHSHAERTRLPIHLLVHTGSSSVVSTEYVGNGGIEPQSGNTCVHAVRPSWLCGCLAGMRRVISGGRHPPSCATGAIAGQAVNLHAARSQGPVHCTACDANRLPLARHWGCSIPGLLLGLPKGLRLPQPVGYGHQLRGPHTHVRTQTSAGLRDTAPC
jgi:hypothetical protein